MNSSEQENSQTVYTSNGETFTERMEGDVRILVRDKDGYVNAAKLAGAFDKQSRKFFIQKKWLRIAEAWESANKNLKSTYEL
jgi:hypothetical protein